MKGAIRSKVFRSWALSYFFVLLMPLLIGSFVYAKSVDTIKNEVKNVNDMALGQLKSVLDANFVELNRVVGSISLNQDIRTLLSLEKPLTAKNMLTVVNVQKDLAKYLMTDTMIEEIYVYISNHDFIVTSAYKYNSDMIQNLCRNHLRMGYGEFSQITHTKLSKEFRMLQPEGSGETAGTSILYLNSLYSFNLRTPAGTLIIKLNTERFRQLLQEMELTNQADVVLVNERNEYYSADYPWVLSAPLQYDAIRIADSTFYGTISGVSTAIAHSSSDFLGLEYISLIPSDVFLQKAVTIRNLVRWYVVICLFVGMIISYLLAKHNYNPLEKLKRMLSNRLNQAITDTYPRNEYIFLENSLRDLLDEKSRAKDMMERHTNAQRNNLLVRLLKGRPEMIEDLPTLLHTRKIAFGGECFLVANAHIEKITESMLKNYDDNDDAYSLIYSIVKNTGEEFLGDRYDVQAAEIDGTIAFIVNTSDESIDVFYDECARKLEKIISFIHDSFGITLSICVSSVRIGLRGLADAYSETLLTHEYKTFVEGTTHLLFFSEINKTQANSFDQTFGFAQQKMLTVCMEAKDYYGARKILDELLINGCHTFMSIQLIKIRICDLIHIALNESRTAIQTMDIGFLDDVNLEDRLLNAKSVTELQEQVHNIFDGLITLLEDPERKKTPDCVVSAEQYVYDHFSEPDLSVAGIADRLGVSISYLSRTYKRYRGVGLLDCIHQTRVEKAKALISSMNISQIAEKVGYYDSKALIRIFRRYEGTTPTKMRDMRR